MPSCPAAAAHTCQCEGNMFIVSTSTVRTCCTWPTVIAQAQPWDTFGPARPLPWPLDIAGRQHTAPPGRRACAMARRSASARRCLRAARTRSSSANGANASGGSSAVRSTSHRRNAPPSGRCDSERHLVTQGHKAHAAANKRAEAAVPGHVRPLPQRATSGQVRQSAQPARDRAALRMRGTRSLQPGRQ